MRALVIDIGGPEGIWSHMHGEGRWDANVAMLFRKAGMEVDVWTNGPTIKEYEDRQEGINFVPNILDQDTQYDVFFSHRPFYREQPEIWKQLSLRIKKAIFGTFWPSVNDCRPIDHGILVSPYRTFSEQTRVLPYAFVDEIEESKFKNRTLIWTSRGPFNTSMGEARFLVNLYHLRATLDAVNDNCRTIFLSYGGDFLYKEPTQLLQNTNLWAEVEDIISQLKQKSNVEFYSYLPQDKFFDLLNQGSIAVRCDGGGSFAESLLRGLVPTVFTPWFWPVFFKDTIIEGLEFSPAGYDSTTEDMVKNRISKLLTDESFYNNQLDLLRKNTPIFTTQQALDMLQEILAII